MWNDLQPKFQGGPRSGGEGRGASQTSEARLKKIPIPMDPLKNKLFLQILTKYETILQHF